eukprot:EG_transcript_56698
MEDLLEVALSTSLEHGEARGQLEDVVYEWVGQVVHPVLHGALSGEDALHEEAEDGHHGQPAVLDLLHLQLQECLGVIGQTQGVERATGVQGVEVRPEVA